MKDKGYNAQEYYDNNPRIQRVIEQILTGAFCGGKSDRYANLMEVFFNHNDEYMLLADFDSYIAKQEEVDALYNNKKLWWKKSIINVANCGFFSSDRTISSYAKDVWKIKEIEE